MPLAQGDLALLSSTVAEELLESRIPARLAYTWIDETPRVVPIYFHWTGDEMVFASSPTSPKVRALRRRSDAAVTVDTDSFPPRVLLLRGPVTIDVQDGVVAEYAAAVKRYMGEEAGTQFLAGMDPSETQMARIALRPTWAAVLDFETRLPSDLGGVIG